MKSNNGIRRVLFSALLSIFSGCNALLEEYLPQVYVHQLYSNVRELFANKEAYQDESLCWSMQEGFRYLSQQTSTDSQVYNMWCKWLTQFCLCTDVDSGRAKNVFGSGVFDPLLQCVPYDSRFYKEVMGLRKCSEENVSKKYLRYCSRLKPFIDRIIGRQSNIRPLCQEHILNYVPWPMINKYSIDMWRPLKTCCSEKKIKMLLWSAKVPDCTKLFYFLMEDIVLTHSLGSLLDVDALPKEKWYRFLRMLQRRAPCMNLSVNECTGAVRAISERVDKLCQERFLSKDSNFFYENFSRNVFRWLSYQGENGRKVLEEIYFIEVERGGAYDGRKRFMRVLEGENKRARRLEGLRTYAVSISQLIEQLVKACREKEGDVFYNKFRESFV